MIISNTITFQVSTSFTQNNRIICSILQENIVAGPGTEPGFPPKGEIDSPPAGTLDNSGAEHWLSSVPSDPTIIATRGN